MTLGPVIGAIAGGNTVVVKPSENASKSAVVIQEVVQAALDPSCYTVIQGGVPETQTLLAERWDKIFFTGGANVGRIVAKAAAPHLTPVVLELGGINPAIISKSADPRLVARRMLWAKVMNAGQICTSQNYLLVDRAIVPAVIEEFKKAYKEFYPQGAKASPDYSRIINEGHFNRLKAMIDNSKGKILAGGTMDEKELFIEPTIVEVNSTDDSMLIQESFGPLVPILPVDDLDEAVKVANSIMATPLGIYPFGSKKDTDRSKPTPPNTQTSDIMVLTTLQSSQPPAPVVPQSTTPLYTSPPSPSAVSARAATAPTEAKPASTPSSTAVPSPPAPAGSSRSWLSGTHRTRARRAPSRRLVRWCLTLIGMDRNCGWVGCG